LSTGNTFFSNPPPLWKNLQRKRVTTHPSIMKGMIRIVRGLEVLLSLGDSPSIESLNRALKKIRHQQVAEEAGCPLVEFDRPVLVERGGRILRKWEMDRSVSRPMSSFNLPK